MIVSRRQFLLGAAGFSVSGCLNTPTPESVSTAARSVGGAAGLVLYEHIRSNSVRRELASAVSWVTRIVPDVGQDRTALWTKMARDHVADLVSRLKMKSTTGCLVLAAFRVVLQAFDILESRYPDIRTVRIYTEAAVDGFGKGFVDTICPDAAIDTSIIDVQAYGELKSSPDVAILSILSSTANTYK